MNVGHDSFLFRARRNRLCGSRPGATWPGSTSYSNASSGAALLLSDMAWTASVGRSHFPYRAGVTFHDVVSLRERLRAVAEAASELEPRPVTGVALAYTGEASDWVRTGRELYEREPVARAVLDCCDGAFRDVRGASLLDIIFGGSAEGDLDDPACAQPALYAIECAVTALWASVGIRPSVVVRHGAGKIAAAQAAGVFTLEDGLRLAASFENSEAVLAAIDMAPPSLTLIDSSTGRPVGPGERLDESYWRQTGEPSVSATAFPLWRALACRRWWRSGGQVSWGLTVVQSVRMLLAP